LSEEEYREMDKRTPIGTQPAAACENRFAGELAGEDRGDEFSVVKTETDREGAM
jgi:hypothetical protein